MHCQCSLKNGANSAIPEFAGVMWERDRMLRDLRGEGNIKFKIGASLFESQSVPVPVTVVHVKLHVVSDNIRPSRPALVRAGESLDCVSSRLSLIPRSRDFWPVYIVQYEHISFNINEFLEIL